MILFWAGTWGTVDVRFNFRATSLISISLPKAHQNRPSPSLGLLCEDGRPAMTRLLGLFLLAITATAIVAYKDPSAFPISFHRVCCHFMDKDDASVGYPCYQWG